MATAIGRGAVIYTVSGFTVQAVRSKRKKLAGSMSIVSGLPPELRGRRRRGRPGPRDPRLA